MFCFEFFLLSIDNTDSSSSLFSCFTLPFVHFVWNSEQLGHRTLWCVPAQVPVIPALPRFPSKPLVMAALAPAVAACAHGRPPAQSLSRPIYLTQTRASRPSPSYLSSAWYILGGSNSLVSLHPGNQNEMRGRWASAFSNQSRVCFRARVHVFVKQFVRCRLWQKHGHNRQLRIIRLILKHAQTHC